MAPLQVLNPTLQNCSLSLGRRRLGSNDRGLRIREIIYDDWRENFLETADYMTFNYLRRDICDECLLGHLEI